MVRLGHGRSDPFSNLRRPGRAGIPFTFLKMERLGHASHKGGMRDDLAFTSRQWAISIRLFCIPGENKLMPWHADAPQMQAIWRWSRSPSSCPVCETAPPEASLAALLLVCVPALWLGIKLDLDIRGRNCDRPVERSPALEGLDELGALLLRDSLEVKVQPNRIEQAHPGPNRLAGIEHCTHGDCSRL